VTSDRTAQLWHWFHLHWLSLLPGAAQDPVHDVVVEHIADYPSATYLGLRAGSVVIRADVMDSVLLGARTGEIVTAVNRSVDAPLVQSVHFVPREV
jgi:hypothetical protein